MPRKHYNENFKKQIVNIYNQGNHTYRSLSEKMENDILKQAALLGKK